MHAYIQYIVFFFLGCMHTYTIVYTCTYVHEQMHICPPIYTPCNIHRLHINMHACIHSWVKILSSMFVYVYACSLDGPYMYMYMCTCMYIQTCTDAYPRTCLHLHVRECVGMQVCIYVYTYAYACIYTSTQPNEAEAGRRWAGCGVWGRYIFACLYACMQVACACITSMHICFHVCMYVCN